MFTLFQHIGAMYHNPHPAFEQEIVSYYILNIPKTISRYEQLLKCDILYLFSPPIIATLYSTTSTSWRRRGLKRVPRSDLN